MRPVNLLHRAVLSAAACAAVVSASLGCTKSSSEAKQQEPTEQRAAAPTEAKSTDPLCVGPVTTEGPEQVLDIGGKQWALKGSTLSLRDVDADDEFVLGQITDVKDHNPDNAANLALVVDWFKKEQVDAIAVTGDLGETAESIEKVLRDVAAAGVPVLAVIGNRECRDHFDAGVKAAQKDLSNIINMNQVRVVNTDEVSFVSMPGYHNRAYLHCAEGCAYSPEDARALPTIAKAATAPVRILVSHGPPLQTGPLAIDRIHEGANVGDPVLAEIMKSDPSLFAFGVFGNIQEAGGYATDFSGQTRVAAETFADSFVFNPGPLDAVRWVMLDGSESVGMAGIVKVKGKQAMYKVHRLKPGEAKTASAVAATPAK